MNSPRAALSRGTGLSCSCDIAGSDWRSSAGRIDAAARRCRLRRTLRYGQSSFAPSRRPGSVPLCSTVQCSAVASARGRRRSRQSIRCRRWLMQADETQVMLLSLLMHLRCCSFPTTVARSESADGSLPATRAVPLLLPIRARPGNASSSSHHLRRRLHTTTSGTRHPEHTQKRRNSTSCYFWVISPAHTSPVTFEAAFLQLSIICVPAQRHLSSRAWAPR